MILYVVCHPWLWTQFFFLSILCLAFYYLNAYFTLSYGVAFVYLMLTGSILINNHNIQNIRLQSLRRHVGLVSQDVVSTWQFLFPSCWFLFVNLNARFMQATICFKISLGWIRFTSREKKKKKKKNLVQLNICYYKVLLKIEEASENTTLSWLLIVLTKNYSTSALKVGPLGTYLSRV